MTNSEALVVAEQLLEAAKQIRAKAGGVDAEEKFAELYGQIRPVVENLLPRQLVNVEGAWNAVTTHDNLIEAGFLSGSGVYEQQGYLQLLQLAGALRHRAQMDPAGSAEAEKANSTAVAPFVDGARLEELRSLSNTKFDFGRLIRLCEELNVVFAAACYHAVALLTRSILDHVPPIFGLPTFEQVASNHSGRSFKDSMDHLQNSARKIADAHLHTKIRERESLPNATQVNFSRDLDVLLAEIVRVSR